MWHAEGRKRTAPAWRDFLLISHGRIGAQGEVELKDGSEGAPLAVMADAKFRGQIFRPHGQIHRQVGAKVE